MNDLLSIPTNTSISCRSERAVQELTSSTAEKKMSSTDSSSSPIEVGEGKRDFVGEIRNAGLPGIPSSSKGSTRMKKRGGKVTRKGTRTSTPVTIQMKKAKRTRKRVTGLKDNALNSVKQRLDEGLLIGLSSSSDEEHILESTGSSLRDAINA